ncbi:CehA/McbA family metallohydrolase, partial [Chloroflexota bacterium]
IDRGLDAIITNDHNVLVKGINRYYKNSSGKVLLLTGEEVHDQARDPQKNHLLVFGVDNEVSTFANNTQKLIDHVKESGGLSFLAHPVDPELPLFNEADISWVDWTVNGFDGIELWNGLSELKTVIRNKYDAIKYGFFPILAAHNPRPETLKLWDNLMIKGNKIVAIGGSDAHALPSRMGPFSKTIYPYRYHFSAINTHLILPKTLSGDPVIDSKLILSALQKGSAFIGYDLASKTRGFRFTAQSHNTFVGMGEEIGINNHSIILEITVPNAGEINLIKDGSKIHSEIGSLLHHTVDVPGVYRVEVYRKFLNKRRGWIFSNPIYISP